MHNDDLPVTETLVRDLLVEHTPQWADQPLHRVNSSGTDNALFRIGDRLVLRIPRRASAAVLVSKELDWLPRLQGLPLATPALRYRGRVDLGIQCKFGIFDWLEGSIASPDNVSDTGDAAVCLAGFLKALHRMTTEGAPAAGPVNKIRGIPLTDMSDLTLPAIEMVSDEINASAARALWDAALAARNCAAPVWLHGDLKADNLLTIDGKLSGVIDWGLAAVGDPAADYATAWSWVQPSARGKFRDTLELDESDWLRGKAWALYGAVIALSYYRCGRNEPLCQQCRLTLARLGLLL
ncbi:aminoglycoside phosphotransferase family protein [Rhizobium sp. FY34]|uniref:aminoglycoside phosphotransferase family protein n=1 Tax=Rhizobium sp. FY34 TaxID=2562309 RepID=UPI0014852188|nr:aminoglycoside phosphotransferase family protein [Rhizobium sp. FY34]